MAVVDFTDLQGNMTELGRFLAEELSVNLTTMAKGFEVIDRTHLKSILTEHKLSMSGLVNPKTVKQLEKIAGVDVIVTGSVTPFGDSIRVSAKVIVTDTARVIGASSGDIPKTKAIEELLVKSQLEYFSLSPLT
ncbi:MAG: FlgO family outer membrane protein [candidate division WOR-3 bacterium]